MYNMNKRITLLGFAVCLMISIVNAQQISITSLAQVYNQDFNTLASTGTTGTAVPNGWYYTGSSYRVAYGQSNTGGLYSFGDTLSLTDRSLGSIGSGSATPSFGAKFVNNTSSTITAITLNFTTENWRLGQKPALRFDSTMFSYNVGVDSLNASGWTTVSALKLITPDTTASIAGALNGNNAPNKTNVSGTINGLAIPAGSNFWIKWTELNVSGSDDGLSVDDLSVSFTGGVVPNCTEPANSVTNVVASATSTTAISGSFTGTTADAYLVVLDSNATVPTITDASSYTVGQAVGTATVISNGTSTSFSRSGLIQNTIYHIYVFPYNNSGCLGGPNYKTTAPGNDTAKTLVDACPEPSVNPTNLIFTSVGNNNIDGRFNRTVPPADGYIVVQSLSSNIGYPLDSVNYNVGDSIVVGSFRSKVADVSANALDTTFSITGLTQGTKYYVAVIPYKLCGAFKNYRRTASNGVNRDDTTTTGTPPLVDCVQPTGVSNTSIVKLDSTTSTISFKWINSANSDSVMIIAAPFSVGTITIRDSVNYPVNTIIPSTTATSAKVYYRGTDSSFTLTGLLTNTLYKIFVVAFNNKNCTNGPNYAGLANTLIRTAAGTDCADPTGVSNTSIIKLDSTTSTISIKWINPSNMDSVMVIAAPSSVGNITIRDSAYYLVNAIIPSTTATNAKVYYRGTDSSVVLTGLTANTLYKIFIVTFRNKNCTNGPNYSGLATTFVRTALSVGVKYNNVEAEFSLFPNPVNTGSLFVKFKSPIREEATLEVVDILGRKLFMNRIAAGNDMQTIDISNLSKGTYILNIVYKGTNNVRTFIVE